MTLVKGSRWGAGLFLSLWLLGLALLAGMGTGLLPGSPLAAGLIVLALCITIAVGVLSQRCGFFAQPLVRVDGAAGHVALTFDDGPDEKFTPQVLDLLKRFGQQATFFVIGDNVRRCPEVLRRIVAEGHEIGNHSLNHPWHMALWSGRRIAMDLEQTSLLIAEITGARPTVFRPPAAVLSPRIAAGARSANLFLVGHSVRSGDGSTAISAEHALRRLHRGLRPGAILLLHDGAVGGRAPASLRILPALCAELERRGLRSVPLSRLMQD